MYMQVSFSYQPQPLVQAWMKLFTCCLTRTVVQYWALQDNASWAWRIHASVSWTQESSMSKMIMKTRLLLLILFVKEGASAGLDQDQEEIGYNSKLNITQWSPGI